MSTPCEKGATIENIMQRLIECEKNIVAINVKVSNFEKLVEKLQKSISGISSKLDRGQNWLIGLLITIIGTFIIDKFF